VLDLGDLDLAFLRLDPPPFDREPVRRVTQGLEQPEVIREAMVVIASDPRRLADVGVQRQFVRPPVVGAVVALYLVCSRGAAEDKGARELNDTVDHWTS
jgi:hypothetical protein